MDADERTARRIVNGVAGLIGLWLLAQFVPAFVAAVLMTGSFLVLLLAMIGFARPSWVRLPNRLAGIWLVALSVGMFAGGGVLLNQDEDEISTANGTPTDEDAAAAWQAELAERQVAIERTARPPMSTEERVAAAQRVADENVRRRREARETRGEGSSSSALQRLMDADGMNQCSLNFQARQRILYGAGSLTRWTTTVLTARFAGGKRRTGTVTTYIGDAIQFQDDDGSWLNAIYECDYDHDAETVIDVRITPGRLP